MKKPFTLTFGVLATIIMLPSSSFARPAKPQALARDTIDVTCTYSMILSKETDEMVITTRNKGIQNCQKALNAGERGLLGTSLQMAYGGLAQQKVANLTENIMDYTISYIAMAIQNRKDRFKHWYVAANNRCHFSKTVRQVDVCDFYALPSEKGAFDAENIMFKGFGFRSVLNIPNSKEYVSCYIYCSLRNDPEAVESMVRHGKFLIQLDTVRINTRWFELPNDSLAKDVNEEFFARHSNLSVTLNSKFYSSWFNEAIMLQKDQELGEFSITIPIDSAACKDGVFCYARQDNTPQLGTISGECFIVPRSYCGFSDNGNPLWGTGQYSVEMTLREDCQIKERYYLKPDSIQTKRDKKGMTPAQPQGDRNFVMNHVERKDSSLAINPDRSASPVPMMTRNGAMGITSGQVIAFANIPEEKMYDKAKWMNEWVRMQEIRNDNSKSTWRNYWSGLWKQVYSVVRGKDFITTYTEPLKKAIINVETSELERVMKLSNQTQAADRQESGGSNTQPPQIK